VTNKDFFSKLLKCELGMLSFAVEVIFDCENDKLIIDNCVIGSLPEKIEDVNWCMEWVTTRLKLKNMIKSVKTTLNLIDAIQN